MAASEQLARRLAAAHREALAVGDSPLRADRLADQLPGVMAMLEGEDLDDITRNRVHDALAAAERALRRDDDGREAARHLAAAMRLTENRPKAPSPFLDDD
ncbi:MAG TPA: hypothetical protein VFQ45_07705 [Longimicrobium sp.]|nr:hypothetical protein [Longimicrobium sp.]